MAPARKGALFVYTLLLLLLLLLLLSEYNTTRLQRTKNSTARIMTHTQ